MSIIKQESSDSDSEHYHHCDWATEGILKLVDRFDKGHGDETRGHGSHGEHTAWFVGYHTKLVCAVWAVIILILY
jgi:hypothetical protein